MLDARVDRLEAALARLADAQAQTQVELRQLAEAQRRTEDALKQLIARVDKLDSRVDRLVGRDLERHYREHAPAFFQTFLRRTRSLTSADVEQLADEAERRRLLTAREHHDLLLANVIACGLSRADDAETYVLAEVSQVVDTGDVDRAARRAALLQKSVRVRVLPVVAGEVILPDADHQAVHRRIWRVLDRRAIPPPA